MTAADARSTAVTPEFPDFGSFDSLTRQPEAKHLYLTTGCEAQFDIHADPETIKSLAFTKNFPGPPLS